MAHGEHADAAREVDQGIAVDVMDERTLRSVDDDVGVARASPAETAA